MKRRNHHYRITNREIRANLKAKDWVRYWFFSTDAITPYLQFSRLNPEE